MIPTLEQFRKEVHDQMQDMRSIYRIIDSETFPFKWEKLTDDEKLTLRLAIQRHEKQTVINVIKDRKKELGELSIRELHILARKKGIRGFMKMPKSILLCELSRFGEELYD